MQFVRCFDVLLVRKMPTNFDFYRNLSQNSYFSPENLDTHQDTKIFLDAETPKPYDRKILFELSFVGKSWCDQTRQLAAILDLCFFKVTHQEISLGLRTELFKIQSNTSVLKLMLLSSRDSSLLPDFDPP